MAFWRVNNNHDRVLCQDRKMQAGVFTKVRKQYLGGSLRDYESLNPYPRMSWPSEADTAEDFSITSSTARKVRACAPFSISALPSMSPLGTSSATSSST